MSKKPKEWRGQKTMSRRPEEWGVYPRLNFVTLIYCVWYKSLQAFFFLPGSAVIQVLIVLQAQQKEIFFGSDKVTQFCIF